MVKVLNKIKQMQIKLNIINSNIDEIKNDRKCFDENKKIDDDFSQYKIEKNIIHNYTNNNSNIIHQKHISNIKKNKTFNHLKNNYFKNDYENNSKCNNDNYFNEKIQEKKNLSTKNIIDNYANIKKNDNEKKHRTSSCIMNYYNKNNLPKNNKIDNRGELFSRKYPYNNNSCINHINQIQKKLINCSNNLNFQKYPYNNNNNLILDKRMNLLTTTQKQVKIKKLFNEPKNKSNKIIYNNNIINANNIKDNKEKIFSGTYNNFIEENKRTIDIDDNKSGNFLYNNNLYDNNKKIRKNIYEKLSIRNNSSTNLNKFNSNNTEKIRNFKNDLNNYYIGDNNNNVKMKRKMSIENIKMKQNSIKVKKDIDYKQMILDIIDITNEYNNNENKINVDNIIDEYKLLLRNTKIKEKFIFKLINKYNNSNNKATLNYNDPKSLISIWNWINSKDNKKDYLNYEDKQYKQLCKEIMKQYNLNNIKDLKEFINKSVKKINTNDNFLIGIKKILSA